ncbi:MAG TPA: SgcJ/EcaC family oxidoreductase [Pyrinomonadaceae bacterium]|nr:SgcJ/EcaC family oxidoreductase [Pyrinomonadaceae bacterium]
MRTVLTLVFIIAVQTNVVQTKQTTADRRAIEALTASFEDSWNRHDVEKLASLVAEDVDYVTVVGSKGWEKGRTEFKNRHTAIHKTMFKESVLTVKETHIRFVRWDLVIAHVLWETKGDVIPDRKPGEPRAGIFTWVLEKRAGRWLIIASQNTDDKQLATGSEAR